MLEICTFHFYIILSFSCWFRVSHFYPRWYTSCRLASKNIFFNLSAISAPTCINSAMQHFSQCQQKSGCSFNKYMFCYWDDTSGDAFVNVDSWYRIFREDSINLNFWKNSFNFPSFPCFSAVFSYHLPPIPNLILLPVQALSQHQSYVQSPHPQPNISTPQNVIISKVYNSSSGIVLSTSNVPILSGKLQNFSRFHSCCVGPLPDVLLQIALHTPWSLLNSLCLREFIYSGCLTQSRVTLK